MNKIPMQLFIVNYCSDIVENSLEYQEALAEDRGFDYEYIEEIEGELKKTITTSTRSIPIKDILDNDEESFRSLYPGDEELRAYRLYRENFEELYGEDALYYIKNQIEAKRKELESYKELDITEL